MRSLFLIGLMAALSVLAVRTVRADKPSSAGVAPTVSVTSIVPDAGDPNAVDITFTGAGFTPGRILGVQREDTGLQYSGGTIAEDGTFTTTAVFYPPVVTTFRFGELKPNRRVEWRAETFVSIE